MHAVSVKTTTGDWKRLGGYIKRRREQLRMSQQDMYARGGPSVATIRILEAGEQEGYRNRTYFQVEEALGWAQGSVEAILSGREPTNITGSFGNATPVKHVTAEAKAAVPTSLEPATQPQRRPTVQELQAELDKLMAQMSPEDRERLDRIIAEEEAALEAMRLERQLKWLKLMRGEPIYPEQDI